MVSFFSLIYSSYTAVARWRDITFSRKSQVQFFLISRRIGGTICFRPEQGGFTLEDTRSLPVRATCQSKRIRMITEKRTADTQMSPWAQKIYEDKYAWRDEDGVLAEDWYGTSYRVVDNVLGSLGYSNGDEEFDKLVEYIAERKFMPGGRYLYASGRGVNQTQNCALYRCEDSREGWADLFKKVTLALTTGAGVGVVYSDIRPNGSKIKSTGGVATGPLTPMNGVNDLARGIKQGGSRRAAIWAGLHWWHADIFDFITSKDWSEDVRAAKAKDFLSPATLDITNISVILDDEFFYSYQDGEGVTEDQAEFYAKHVSERGELAPDGGTWKDWAHRVYDETSRHMIQTAEPGFSIDTGENHDENLRNACTEVTSEDDSDICNLGSINLARIESLSEMEELVSLGTLFLLAGTVYSALPHKEIEETRTKNRRLGLGIMGVHEWLLKNGSRYEWGAEFEEYARVYATSTEVSHVWADKHSLSRPVKTRAIAPTGTIGIVAETTTGVEPIFCVAEKRRFVADDDTLKYQYVINPTANNLIENYGVDPNDIESAYDLAYNYERRIKFQAEMQKYVDHAISSTINLPYPITDELEIDLFKSILYKYLPQLRGVTCYPDGARAGQPLTAVPYEEARGQTGVTFEEDEARACASGSCGA